MLTHASPYVFPAITDATDYYQKKTYRERRAHQTTYEIAFSSINEIVAHPMGHDNLLYRGDLLSLGEKRQMLPLVELEKALPLLAFRLREKKRLYGEGCHEVF